MRYLVVLLLLTTRYHEHDVEDDVAECEETFEEKCEDVTQGYTTEQVVEECISTDSTST